MELIKRGIIMKSILMSIKPQYVAKILNGEKTIEIRKKFPKDYVGWVYIYCTKQSDLFKSYIRLGYYTTRSTADDLEYNGKGKVVAKFQLQRITPVSPLSAAGWTKEACVSEQEILDYINGKEGYLWHIDNLEIFDEPKELKSFLVHSHTVSGIGFKSEEKQFDILKPLNRAPQSWCYVEL